MIERSSGLTNWATPKEFYDFLDYEFHFTCDVCAESWNAKHKNFWTVEDDSLSLDWSGVCFMNPPYGRNIGLWVEKALKESRRGVTVVGLLPARTDARWFHDSVYGKAKLRFVRGRIKFERPDGVRQSPTFGSMIAVWRGVT